MRDLTQPTGIGRGGIVALALLCLAAGPGPAVPAAAPYLAAAQEPDASVILAVPPAANSAAKQRDIAAFHITRGLQDSDRWALATRDADLRPEALAGDFSCAAGLRLDTAPTLVRLLGRLEADAEAVTRPAKRHFAVPRPEVGNDAPICVARDPGLDRNFAYPSGHTTIGWASALVLTELLPDRATAILQRGRIFGESRVVCGVHWLSDVEAGRTSGAALMAVLQTSPAFQADLTQARQEIARLRLAPAFPRPEQAMCTMERAAADTLR